MAFRNICKGRHNFRNHPVNSDRDKKWGGIGRGDKYFRLDAEKQGRTLNHPIHLGSVNLACEVFIVSKSLARVSGKNQATDLYTRDLTKLIQCSQATQ